MVQIIPAILATTEAEYSDKLHKIEKSGLFEGGWIQIDLMDHKFVQNQSIGPDVMVKYPTDLKKEAHLMVVEPYTWVDELVRAGVKRVITPIELHYQEIDRFFDVTLNLNIELELGLSINPETELEKLEPYMDKIDVVLIMAVHPGKSGQEFIAGTINKIKETSRLRSKDNGKFKIGVDGGISIENAKVIVDSGADYLVVGSHLLEGDIEENLEKLWEAIHG